jgi:hypothetical protein
MRGYTFLIVATTLFIVKNTAIADADGSSNQRYNLNPNTLPISLSHGLNKRFASLLKTSFGQEAKTRWERGTELAVLEQSVEDYNAAYIASSSTSAQACKHRRLIALPILKDSGLDPPMGTFSHGHVQNGDKMSLPANFQQAVVLNNAEVPYLFRVSRIEGVTAERVTLVDSGGDDDDNVISKNLFTSSKQLDELVGGPLDFRAPNAYIFLPLWMFRALGLRPRDIVQVELVETIPAGSLAKFRPRSSDFTKDIANPQAVMETELRHYSTLTMGSTIAFDYNKKTYWLDVEDLRAAPRGEKKSMVKVQDTNLRTEFLPAKDVKKKRKKRGDADEL